MALLDDGSDVLMFLCVTIWKIPVDQPCKETVNTATKTPGATKAVSLKLKAVSKYYLEAEYGSIFMRNLKDMLYLNTSSCLHNDLQKSKVSRDESDINPSEIEQQDLVCLSTGKITTKQIENDVLQAQDIGERAHCCLREERLESNPANGWSFSTQKRQISLLTSKGELPTKS